MDEGNLKELFLVLAVITEEAYLLRRDSNYSPEYTDLQRVLNNMRNELCNVSLSLAEARERWDTWYKIYDRVVIYIEKERSNNE